MKLRSALLLVVAATVCALSGLISPQEAAASVDAVNQWPAKPTIASNSSASPVSGIYTPGIGTNRLMLVAVATRYSVAGAAGITASYGGQALTQIATTGSAMNGLWLGFLKEAPLATGAAGSKILSVSNSNTTNLTNMYVTAAVFNGVDQIAALPYTGSGATALASAATTVVTPTITATGNAGLTGNTGLAVYVTNWAGTATASTVSASGTFPAFIEVRDSAGPTGTNINLASGYSVTTGAPSGTLTSTAAINFGAIVAVVLNPATKTGTNYQTVTTCGDCHGNPPQDGPGLAANRNVWPGQFPGSHDKHAGKDEGQYGQACTLCHRDNGTAPAGLHHSNGYKNVSGSSVPRTVGGYTGNGLPSSNSPTWGTCSNVSCHSNGRTTPKQLATTPVWGTPAAAPCLACHGGRSNTTNNYARSANNFSLSTTHGQHLGKYSYTQINCNTCHGKTAANHTALKDYSGTSRHGNGTKNVIFTNVAYGSYTSYKSVGSGSVGTSKTCSNVSCHGGTTRSAWNENVTTNQDNTCVHCHGAAGTPSTTPNTGYNRRFFAPGWGTGANKGISTDGTASSNNVRVGSHFKHLSSVYMKAIKCNECHRVPSNPFDVQHTDSPRYNSQTLTFAQASTATITIGVGASGTLTRLAAFNGYTSGTVNKAATCSSVYCHGNRMKNGETGGTYRKPYWNYSAMINYTDKATACTRCHGYPPTSNSHSTSQVCSTCHSLVVDTSNNIKDKTLHINGKVEASGGHVWSYGGSKHMADATGVWPFATCTGSCHTNLTGTGTQYPPSARGNAALVACVTCHTNTTNFQGATPGCWDCHGSGATAANATPNGNAFPNISGSHSAHMVWYACSDCHVGGGTGSAVHGNYSSKPLKTTKADVNVKLNPTTAGLAAGYSGSATTTCVTSVCHGQKSPKWGQVVPAPKCLRCHGNQSVATLNNFTSSLIAPGTGNNDTNQVAGVTQRGGAHQEHLKASDKMSRQVRCIECHTSVATVNHAQALDNRTTAKVTFGGVAVTNTYHPVPTVTRASGIVNCSNVECHTGRRQEGTGAKQAGYASRPALAWNNGALIGNTSIADTCTDKCHGMPPGRTVVGDTHETKPAVVNISDLSNCSSQPGNTGGCHPDLNAAPSTMSNIWFDRSLHVNGIVEGGDCISCHSSKQGVRAAVVGEFALQSHHVQGRTPTLADCYMCHLEAADTVGTTSATYHLGNPGGSVDLVVMTGAMGTGTRGTYTYIAYTANGTRKQIRKINDHCLGCHNPTNSGIAPFVAGSFPGKYSPEPNLPVPKTASSIQARYSSTRTVAWSNFNYSSASRFGTNGKKNITKALSAHGNAIKNEFPNWDPAVNGKGEDGFIGTYGGDIAPPTLGANRNVFCYDCHNAHGSAASGITSSYNSATGTNAGGLLKTTVNGERGYKVDYTPAARTIIFRNYSAKGQTTATTTNTLFNTGASLCNDCHNNDTQKVNISKPWSITGTYSSTKAIVGYWSTPYFDNYTFASAERTAYKQGGTVGAANDRRKPMGGHFGSSIPSRQAGHAAEINGLCTPCHDPHGVSKTALSTADQAYAVPMLKGTWVTSPYKEDKAGVVVKRGGGSWSGFASSGAVPGYHIDQNTLVAQPAPVNGGASMTTSKTNQRQEQFAPFTNSAATQQTTADTQFAGLCIGCHNKASLTNSTNTTAATWKTTGRIHQAVKGWAAAGSSNAGNVIHAYTCSKCHAPHVSRLPRLMVTNCLDVNHFKQVPTGGAINATKGASTAFAGNLYQSTARSGKGAGRFPGGGSNYYATTSGQVMNVGPWWFMQPPKPSTYTADSTANYGSNCHNATNAGGATYDPTKQKWNRLTPW